MLRALVICLSLTLNIACAPVWAGSDSKNPLSQCLSKIYDQMLRSSMDHYHVTVPVADTQAPIFFLRSQQIQFLERIMDSFGPKLSAGGQRILEIGYGSPSMAESLRRATGASVTALDLYDAPGSWIELMPEIDFVSGHLPRDGLVRRVLLEKGPYDLIYAQDVWKAGNEFKWGEPFDPGVSGPEYLAWLQEITHRGSVIAALNDFGAPLAFSRAEVESAGFVVTRWDEPIRMDLHPMAAPKLRAKYGERLGDLRYFEFQRPTKH